MSTVSEYPEQLFEDPQGEVNWVNLSSLKFDASGIAYMLNKDSKKLLIKNIKQGENGKVLVYNTENRQIKIQIPHSMIWVRSSDILAESDACKLHDDPQIVSFAGNFVHELG
jgi:hypothetical protein